MTFLGKVFTLMVFLLSLGFFVLSGIVNARHISYKKLVEDKQNGFKTQLQREQNKTRELQELVQRTKDALALEQLGRRVAISALQSENKDLRDSFKRKEAELANATSQVTLLTATEAITTAELNARKKEIDELNQQLAAARADRDAQYLNFAQTYDRYVRLQGNYQTLDKEAKNLGDRFAAAKEKMDAIGITPETKLDGPPAVNGVVTAISNNLVEVSIGLDDGIRIGDQLDVYRGGQYVGRINVTRSVDDKAVGEILPQYSKGFIVVGDRVDSRLNEIYVRRPAAQ